MRFSYRDVSLRFDRLKHATLMGLAIGVMAGILGWSLVAEPMPILLSTPNILIFTVILALMVRLVFFQQSYRQLLRVGTMVVVPVVIGLIWLLFQANPQLADTIAKEDAVVEDVSFGLLLLGAVAMLGAAWCFLRARLWLVAGVSCLFGLLFVGLAGEEVSWFQRFLGLESNEFFLENNMQKETNLHNLDSHLFNRVYYLCGFLLLVILPYFRTQFTALLRWLRLPTLQYLLPPTWLLLPFILTFSYLHHTGMRSPLFMFMGISSILILSKLWYESTQARSWFKSTYIAIVAGLFTLNAYYFLLTNLPTQGIRHQVGSEYMELFIAWGVFAYAGAVMLNSVESKIVGTI